MYQQAFAILLGIIVGVSVAYILEWMFHEWMEYRKMIHLEHLIRKHAIFDIWSTDNVLSTDASTYIKLLEKK